jgi:uncharacterized membrane protein
MPPKKAAPRSTASPDAGMIWKWVFVIGALVSAVVGAIGLKNDILTWVLILAGVLVGLFWRSTEDLMGFGIRYLLLAAVATALDAVPAIGGYLTGFFQGFVAFLGPVALATLFMYFVRKYLMSMM